jgi:hypothetical protein
VTCVVPLTGVLFQHYALAIHLVVFSVATQLSDKVSSTHQCNSFSYAILVTPSVVGVIRVTVQGTIQRKALAQLEYCEVNSPSITSCGIDGEEWKFENMTRAADSE